jgi:TonB family protein
MSEKEKNIIYTARDIEQYLAGNLSPLQMHVMEKAALNDPFLAEAIEGYEGVKDKEWNNQLVALREAISGKGAIAKVIPLRKPKTNWWKYVAAITIIGSATAVTFMFNKGTKEEKVNPQIAQTISVGTDSAIQIELPEPASVTESLNPTASSTVEEKKTIPGKIAQLDNINKRTETNIIPQPGAPQLKPVEPAVASGSAAGDKVTEPSARNNNVPAAANENTSFAKDENAEKNKPALLTINETEAPNRQQNQGLAKAKKEAVLNNFFTAQIVGADNAPLPFTNISIKKENFGTYADAKGVVRLVSTDSVLNVEVRSVGYMPKTFALRSTPGQTKIVLQEEEIAINDKKIISNTKSGNAQKSRRATLLKDTVVNVEPADGWENYNTYVANNLEIPETKLRDDFHGEVELSFDVKSNGTVSNIRVNKSLGSEYDEAAKRLILEGPQWKVKKGRKTSTNIKVQF